jgi:transcriptional regulator with GAF, ATPase, and Fis domain
LSQKPTDKQLKQRIKQFDHTDFERMETILSVLNTGLALINADMTIAWVNDTIRKILPWGEPVGEICYEFCEKRTEPCEGCSALMTFGDGQIHENVRQSPIDGKWHHIVSVPVKDEFGTVVQVLESTSDITAFKQTEEARDRALKKLEALKNRLEEENIYLKQEIREAGLFSEIIGKSNALLYVLARVKEVAETDTSVLVQGETGVGKELISLAIHEASHRSEKSFIKVNCAALPVNLVESELFGYEPGAFTGALKRHMGRFELANGGTLFLDEISELSFETQAKLLRVLQDGEFERLGGTRTFKTDVRVIAATNRDLNAEITTGRFRADLFYRLNVYPITVPPLRKRREDIPLLVEHFVPVIASRIGRHIDRITVQTLEQLKAYDWPGNVRELKNVLERAIISSSNPILQLPEAVNTTIETQTESQEPIGEPDTLETVERRHILNVLKLTDWRISGPKGAAKILGLNPSTLRFRIKKLGIRRND